MGTHEVKVKLFHEVEPILTVEVVGTGLSPDRRGSGRRCLRRLRGSRTPARPFRVSVALSTLVHMAVHMVETQVRGGVTTNFRSPPAVRQSTARSPLSAAWVRGVASVVGFGSVERGVSVARVADEVVKIPGHRVPPQDLDAERSVLGSMLLSTEAMADVVEILEADDFYRSAHGKIYQALRTLFAQGEPIDIITAVDALRRDGHPGRGGRRPVPARPGR